VNQKQFHLKSDWKKVLGSSELASWMNSVAKIINGTGYISGGDSILTQNGIILRGKGGDGQLTYPPWKLRALDGLSVAMVDGKLSFSNEQGIPTTITVSMANKTVSDNATTEFWLETNVEAVALGAYLYVWTVTSASVQSGSSLPDPMITVDLSDPVNGYGVANFHIGTVAAAEGVLSISNEFTGVFPTIYPMGILLGPVGCNDIGSGT